jgi:FixJ family two-component response regulator
MDTQLPWVAVVDDEASIRRALLRLLRSAGIPALAFDSAESFLAALPAGAPCCAVLDVHMPGRSGLELQALLAVHAPDVGVIIMTGHHTPEEQARALQHQPLAYLHKPMNDQQLLAAIVTTCPAWSPR